MGIDCDGPATNLPVPIALAQDPAPVDLDMLVTHGQTRARLTIQKSVSSKDYNQLNNANPKVKNARTSSFKRRRSSTSEAKNCFSGGCTVPQTQ